MIVIQDWVAAIPAEEKHVAYVGEGMAETREFFFTGADWEKYKEWSFHLDLGFDLSSVTAVDRRQVEQTKVDSSETVSETQVITSATTTKEQYTTEQKQVNWEPATDIVSLDKSVETNGIRLVWTVLRQHTHLPGRLLATLRAVGSTFAQVKKSALMVFEVEPAVEASPAVVLPTSEFEEMESRMDALLEQARQAAEEASEWVLEAYGHAGDAATKALLAADSAAAAADSARRAELAAADMGATGSNGVAITVDDAFSETSVNPVQNKVITAAFNQANEEVTRSIQNLGQTLATHTNAIQSMSNTLKTLSDDMEDKQAELVSGQNIKTVNGQSLLGSGNITIEGGGGGASVTVDDAFSETSENPVQNKVITAAMNAATESVSAAFGEFSDVIQNGIMPRLAPAVTAADNGKVLAVVDGVWTAVAIPSAEGASF